MQVKQAEITVRNGEKVLADVLKAVRSGDTELDFAAVKKIDSAALAVILAAQRAAGQGKALTLLNQPAQLNSLVAAYGVQSLFD